MLEPPFKDELVTSWIARNALQFGIKPSRLSTLIFEDTDAWKGDIDVYLNPLKISTLNKNTEIPESTIRNLTFYFSCDYFYNQTKKTTQVKWVMPIGVRTKNKNYGLQYCPCCLDEDSEKPYFRKLWRLGFMTCCTAHSVQLHDRCPKCYQPIDLKRIKKQKNKILYSPEDLVHCSNCEFDLRKTKYTIVSPEEYEINRINFLQVTLGYGNCGNLNFNYSNLYFEGIRRLLSFLVCRPKGEKLFIDLRNKLDIYQPYHRELIGHNIEPERLDVNYRRSGQVIIYQLLQNWPDIFIDVCRTNEITSHLIKTPYLEFPFWITDALFFRLKQYKYTACKQEKQSVIKYFEYSLNKQISEEKVSKLVRLFLKK